MELARQDGHRRRRQLQAARRSAARRGPRRQQGGHSLLAGRRARGPRLLPGQVDARQSRKQPGRKIQPDFDSLKFSYGFNIVQRERLSLRFALDHSTISSLPEKGLSLTNLPPPDDSYDQESYDHINMYMNHILSIYPYPL